MNRVDSILFPIKNGIKVIIILQIIYTKVTYLEYLHELPTLRKCKNYDVMSVRKMFLLSLTRCQKFTFFLLFILCSVEEKGKKLSLSLRNIPRKELFRGLYLTYDK